MSSDDLSTAGVRRRTLIKAGAWSVPVIAMTSATPAFAASCKTGPEVVSRVDWTLLPGSELANDRFTGWLPASSAAKFATGTYVGSSTANAFTSGADNGSTSKDAVITATYTFPAVARATYSVAFNIIIGHGNPPVRTERQNVVVDAYQGQGSATTVLARATARHSGVNSARTSDRTMSRAGYTVITPSATAQAFSGTVLAATTGLLTIRYTFTLISRQASNWVNDDIWISAPVVNLLTCPR